MRKCYASFINRRFLLVIALFFLFGRSESQTTINTMSGTTGYTDGNGVAGNSCVTFVIENNSGSDILLTDVSTFLREASTGTVATLWYSSTSLSGAVTVATPAWTQIVTTAPTTITAAGIQELFPGLSFTIPAGAQYRFAVQSTIDIRYAGSAAGNADPDIFTSGGVTLKCGEAQIAGANVGYGGPFPTPGNNPRWFIGSITFQPAALCVTPPTPGTATISPAGVFCTGVPLTLNLSGHTAGSGQTYQWQSASSLAGPYTNISPVQNTSALGILSPPTVRYYRCAITCGGNTQISTPVQASVNPALPAGNYTINSAVLTGGTNYQTFAAAISALSCGIAGPVTFTVEPNSGPYNEQVIIPYVAGTSAINTITFKGNGNTLQYANTTNTERAVLKLRGAKYFIFDSLNINANGATYGFGVHLINNADSNVIRKCTITSSTTATNTNFAGIAISGADANAVGTGTTLCDYNRIDSNTIVGGYYGITLVATFSGGANGYNEFTNNKIQDFYQYGVYVGGSYFTTIEKNIISRPTRTTVGEFNGIYFNTQSNNALVSKNRITDPFGGAPTSNSNFFGIYFNTADASAGNANRIYNNLIYNINGNGPVVGIANTGSTNGVYLHNTISLDNTSSTATGLTRGYQQQSSPTAIIFDNNLITITRGGAGQKHCVYFSNLPLSLDYNNYYINAAGGTNYIGFFGTNHATLTAWQAATSQEANSISMNPVYTDPAAGNFAPANAGMDNKGFFFIPTDIENNVRSFSNPDIGAYEFTPPPCSIPPVSGTTVITPTTVCQNAPVFVNLNIGAFGSGQTFQWESATNINGPYTAIGSPMMTPDTTLLSTVTSYYRCAIRCASSTVYSDTVLLTVNPAFAAGSYTINKNGLASYVPGVAGGNFLSFNAAYNAMRSCGILGPVVLNVIADSGPYDEQLIIDSITGVSSTNTITFMGNGNTLGFNATLSNDRAVIKLRNTTHITFDSLTINASNGTYGYGVQLINNADSNTFRKCTILSSTTVASTNFAGIVINSTEAGPISTGNTLCDGNTFDRNTINGGYYGVTLLGSVADPVTNNRFTNNLVKDFFSHGFYVAGSLNTLIENNVITRPTRTGVAPTSYGIQVTTLLNNGLHITRNTFTNFFGGSPAGVPTLYGIQHNAVDAAPGNENFITNNLFYNLGGNGPIFALHNLGSDNVYYFHNTISLDDVASTATGATVGFQQATAATGILFKNNIITIKRGGAGLKHAVYFGTATSEIESDRNDFYLNAGGTANYVGFYNSVNRATLADWQTATGDDANSFSVEPVYTDAAGGDFSPNFMPLDNKGAFVDVTVDIRGNSRNTTTPDIGAYEFTPAPCAGTPVAGTATATPNTLICLETPIVLDLTGNSPVGTITFQWQHSPDGVSNWTNLGPLQFIPQYHTIATTNRFYRCIVTCNSVTATSTVAEVTLAPVVLAGTYTIDLASATTWPVGTNFQSFTSAVNAILCGITGPVVFNVKAGTYNEQIRIPKIPNTSTTNTITFQSENGSAASVNLSFNAADANSNYTVKLDSASHFIFRNLTVTALNTSFGRVFDLAGSASRDSILNCIINAPVGTGTSNAVAGIFANALKGERNVITGNTINNGSSGIYFAGTGTGANLTADHIIANNTVNTPHYYGIYTGFQKRLKLNNNTVNATGTLFSTAYGIYATDCDSSYEIRGNNVVISNSTAIVNGIYVNNCDTASGNWGKLVNNKVTAMTNNSSVLYGLYISNSPGIDVLNNTVAINTTGTSSYGLYNNNSNHGHYWNNSINSTAVSATNNFAAYFINTSANNLSIRNNVFAHKGGGKALFVTNTTQVYGSDYNMLYTTGAILAQRGAPAVNYATINDWKLTFWDVNSISFNPAFISDNDLQPAVSNPDVWAMHGRGIQIAANNLDHNNNPRPTTLTSGVPDLGAYEFFPTAQPSILTAVPATPAPNITQAFLFGSDTVMKLKWKAVAPPSIEVRRFSGVVPTGLLAGTDSMYFYTKVDIPGGGNYNYDIQQYYIDPWQGSIPSQFQIGLGRTTASNSWVVGFTSTVDVARKVISQADLSYMDRFTGLINPFAPPVPPDNDSSNRGKRFWVAYGHHYGMTGTTGGAQDMRIYLSADQPANVQIKINGTTWVRNYIIPANTAIQTEPMPKTGADDARILDEGLFNKGISITSDVPIVAYAHTYQGSNSGAGMLLPVGVYGYEYLSLNSKQYYPAGGAGSYSWVYVIADNDNTVVEITPSVTTKGGRPAGVPFQVTLNKGEVYNVMGTISGATGTDMTGTSVKAIANSNGVCYPVAVFSGSSRTAICNTTNGDNIMQQVFPYSAWGKRYLTFATASSLSNTAYYSNIWRVKVKDPTTVVRRNGVQLTGLITPGNYYEFSNAAGNGASTASYIVADKPVLVGQYMVSSDGTQCPGVNAPGGTGDPELIYISPIEQGIKKAVFYNTNLSAISSNYINVIIPANGLSSLNIDGTSTFTDVFDHPSLPGYKCVRHNLGGSPGQHIVQSDSMFTAITYGLGSVESYGYNAGTLVRTLNATGAISNTLSSSGTPTEYTCAGSPFKFKVYLPLIPTSLTWKLGAVPNLTPNANVVLSNPTPSSSTVRNGVTYYEFTTPLEYSFSAPGIYPVEIEFAHPDIESCDHTQTSVVYVQVLPAPTTDFDIVFSGCAGDVAQFNGQALTQNGVVVSQWQWTFHDNTKATGQNANYTFTTAGTFMEKLRTITPDGCIGDTEKQVTVNPRPSLAVVQDSIAVCRNANATFSVLNPDPDITYNWYTSASSTTPIATGVSYTATNITTTTAYFVEGTITAGGGCPSIRRRVVAAMQSGLNTPVVTTTATTNNSLTFSWTAVTGASGYEVSVNSGAFGNPSSGATGLSHTVSGLNPLESVSISVRAISSCEVSLLGQLNACTNASIQLVTDSIQICNGTTATFVVQAPLAGATYNWYNALTGGASQGSGTSFTTPSLTTTTNYYVQAQSTAGCTNSPRLRAVASVLPALGQIVAVVDSAGANTIRFKWNAVPGSVSYQVSTDGGASFNTPSSGPTGLFHVVSGLTPFQEVTLIVRANGATGCQPSVSQAVTGRTNNDDIFIPNSFTPNGDGLNDVLLVYSYAIQEMQFMIFNQWGQKIFESKSQSTGWDGRHSGKAQPSGVYMYVAKFTLRNGTVVTRKGSINLIR